MPTLKKPSTVKKAEAQRKMTAEEKEFLDKLKADNIQFKINMAKSDIEFYKPMMRVEQAFMFAAVVLVVLSMMGAFAAVMAKDWLQFAINLVLSALWVAVFFNSRTGVRRDKSRIHVAQCELIQLTGEQKKTDVSRVRRTTTSSVTNAKK